MSTASISRDDWWALVLGGVGTVLFGLAVVFWPSLTLLGVLYLFSAYVLLTGIVYILAGLNVVGHSDTWFLPVVLGAFQLGVGVYLLQHTTVKFTTFIVLIGFTLIATGVFEAVNAYYTARLAAKAQAISYLAGLGGVVAGIVILFAKQAHGVGFAWILGIYAIVVGTIHIAELAGGDNK
ncbi:MAG: HdeD family acid-resistance protein [Candidatus Saccharimonadales bacterium]